MTKEEIKQICQIYDNLRAERDAATIAYNSEDTFWEHVLVTYNLSRPSLPSSLDETVEEYAPDFSNDFASKAAVEAIKDAFKAGAEWMADYAYSEVKAQEQPQVADVSKMEPEVELEKASRNVYESWKGGTMDDFLRDMVELGKALNARKEE